MKEIKHQMQPTPDTCTSACLAMILDVPVANVVEFFHKDWTDGKTDPAHFLVRNLAKIQIHREPYNNTLLFGKVYLLTVPSVNITGRNHHIIVDMRHGEGKEIVYDPNQGRMDCSYYVGWTKGRQEIEQCPLKSWMIDLIIDLGE
jgi:hypothetical protein